MEEPRYEKGYFFVAKDELFIIETVPKKSEKCFLENRLKTKSLIVLKLSFIYQKHWALNNWFIWPLIRLIKK